MLTKAQKIILYLSAIAALLIGVVLIIPFRTIPVITINSGKIVILIELLVKGALLLPMLGLTVYPCILKYKQIAGKFERSRVVNVMSYLPLAVYVSGLLILNINILSYNQEVLPLPLWTLSFLVQLFDLAFIIVGFVLLPKFLMKLTKNYTIFFDVAVGIIAIATLVISILLTLAYFNAFENSIEYFGTGAPYGPVLFFTYVFALVAFVSIAILTYNMVRKDETELYINFDLQREQIDELRQLAYNEAYNDILDDFEEYFDEAKADEVLEELDQIEEELEKEDVKEAEAILEELENIESEVEAVENGEIEEEAEELFEEVAETEEAEESVEEVAETEEEVVEELEETEVVDEQVEEETEDVEEEVQEKAQAKAVEKEVIVVKDEEDARRIAELEAQLAELSEAHSEKLEDLQDDIEDAEEEAEAAKAEAEEAKVAAEAARTEAEIAKAEAEAIKAVAAAKAAEAEAEAARKAALAAEKAKQTAEAKKAIKPSYMNLVNYASALEDDGVTVVANDNETQHKFYLNKKLFLVLTDTNVDYRMTFLASKSNAIDLIIENPKVVVKATSPKGPHWYKLTNKGTFEGDQLKAIIKGALEQQKQLLQEAEEEKARIKAEKAAAKKAEKEAAKAK